MKDVTLTVAVEANDAGDAAHLHFIGREHDTDGRDCWCRPAFYRVCDECTDGCWKCDGGKHELTAEEAAATDDVLLIVHRA